MAKTRPVRGLGLHKSASERDLGLTFPFGFRNGSYFLAVSHQVVIEANLLDQDSRFRGLNHCLHRAFFR